MKVRWHSSTGTITDDNGKVVKEVHNYSKRDPGREWSNREARDFWEKHHNYPPSDDLVCQFWIDNHPPRDDIIEEWVEDQNINKKEAIVYIEASESTEHISVYEGVCIFLAGGITGCPDWQQDMVKLLYDARLTLLNPRREDFPIHDPNAALEQITWEHEQLRFADAILFWFPCETICPIVLYELGAWSMTDKPIFVGVHPDYQKRQDVEIQTALVRPDVEIVYTLQDLAEQIREYNSKCFPMDTAQNSQ